MTNRAVTAFLAAILVLALAACSSATSAPSSAEASAEASEPSVAPASSEAAEPSDEPSASEDAGAEEVRVRIDNSNFDPEELTIAVGTEVTWVNADTFAHTVTEGTDGQAVDDPIVDEGIDQGGAVSVTFDEPGTYEITCQIHPSMNMTITVEG